MKHGLNVSKKRLRPWTFLPHLCRISVQVTVGKMVFEPQIHTYPKTSIFDELVVRVRNPLSIELDLLTMRTTTSIIPHFFMKSSTPSFVLVVLTQRPAGGRNYILCVLKWGRLCLMSFEPNFSKRERKIVHSVALNYGCRWFLSTCKSFGVWMWIKRFHGGVFKLLNWSV